MRTHARGRQRWARHAIWTGDSVHARRIPRAISARACGDAIIDERDDGRQERVPPRPIGLGPAGETGEADRCNARRCVVLLGRTGSPRGVTSTRLTRDCLLGVSVTMVQSEQATPNERATATPTTSVATTRTTKRRQQEGVSSAGGKHNLDERIQRKHEMKAEQEKRAERGTTVDRLVEKKKRMRTHTHST